MKRRPERTKAELRTRRLAFLTAVIMTCLPAVDAFAEEPAPEGGLPPAVQVDLAGDGSLVCYIDGIPEESAEEVSSRAKESFRSDEVLEDPVIIDAEKKTIISDRENPDCDSMLCWSAAISDMLWATGWGEQMTDPQSGNKFASEDELMDYFNRSFSDGSNRQEIGFRWIFDGVAVSQDGYYEHYAKLKDIESREDALLPDYSGMNLVTVTNILQSPESISALDSIRDGIPLSLSVEGCSTKTGEGGGGHAITALGLVIDPNAEGTDAYKYILLADSDNTPSGEKPRNTAPNILTYYPLKLKTDPQGNTVWEVVGLSSEPEDEYYRIKTVYALAPYGSAEAEAAIEKEGTRNSFDTPDLILDSVFTSLEEGSENPVTEFEADSSVWLNFVAVNESYTDCKETFPALVTLTRESDGEAVSFYVDCNTDAEYESLFRVTDSLLLNDRMTMSAGNYSVSVVLNPPGDGRMTEAYYLNNFTLTQLFTVLGKPAPIIVNGGFVMLVPDAQARYILGSGKEFGVLVNIGAASFEGLERLTDTDAGKWTPVPASDYVITEINGTSFRLVFAEGYLDSLGPGVHCFRFLLAGSAYRCDITVTE